MDRGYCSGIVATDSESVRLKSRPVHGPPYRYFVVLFCIRIAPPAGHDHLPSTSSFTTNQHETLKKGRKIHNVKNK